MGRRVLVTGHTGFKGAWLTMVLRQLGAEVSGYALPADSPYGLFTAGRVVDDLTHEMIGDVRDLDSLDRAMVLGDPEVIFHLAAQSLVRPSYDDPVQTFDVNVMGTVNVMQAARSAAALRAMVVITSDKSYENVGQLWGYRESDKMGGHDPYSASKGATEIVAESMRRSFFNQQGTAAIACVRAGNVIGGGDWAKDRLVPDIMRGFVAQETVIIRNPDAVRPWQHVLDPVLFYLRLAQQLVEVGQIYAGGWNVGPGASGEVDVSTLMDRLVRLWDGKVNWRIETNADKHEATFLTLDCTKARRLMNWFPALTLDQALGMTAEWYRHWSKGGDIRALTRLQIARILESADTKRIVE